MYSSTARIYKTMKVPINWYFWIGIWRPVLEFEKGGKVRRQRFCMTARAGCVQSAASRRQSRTQALSLRTKDELIQFLHARFSLETRPVWHPGGRFWALRGSTACRRHGAEIRSPKSCDAAEWSAVQNNFAVICPSSSSSFYIARHHTIDNPTSHPHERDA